MLRRRTCACRNRCRTHPTRHHAGRPTRRYRANIVPLSPALRGLTAAVPRTPRQSQRPHPPAPRQVCPYGTSRVTRSRRSEEHTSELQSQSNLVCRLLLEKKKKKQKKKNRNQNTKQKTHIKHNTQ